MIHVTQMHVGQDMGRLCAQRRDPQERQAVVHIPQTRAQRAKQDATIGMEKKTPALFARLHGPSPGARRPAGWPGR